MKSLTNRGIGGDDDDDDDDLPPAEPGIVPDYDKPPRFPANENLIVRTVELVSQEYKEVSTID